MKTGFLHESSYWLGGSSPKSSDVLKTRITKAKTKTPGFKTKT